MIVKLEAARKARGLTSQPQSGGVDAATSYGIAGPNLTRTLNVVSMMMPVPRR